MKNKLASLLLALTMIAAPVAVHAEGEGILKGDQTAVLWDLFIVRPISYAVVVGGAVLYVPAAIVTAAGGNDLKPVKDIFLRAPYKFAVERPLGHFEGE